MITVQCGGTKREITILKGRLGWLDGRKWKLEELGQSAGVTRERVRQIENKTTKSLGSRKVVNRLERLWIAIDDVLNSHGGVCFASEVAESLGKRWGWTALPSDEALANLIKFLPKRWTVSTPPIRIAVQSHPCKTCRSVRPVLVRAIEQGDGGRIPLSAAVERMETYCRSRCEHISPLPKFSKGFIYEIADAGKMILADLGSAYTEQAWAIRQGSVGDLVEAILFQAQKAMHYSEVLDEIRRERPDYAATERNVLGTMSRLTALLLWDRGTYIHRNHVRIPHDLIDNIELDILRRLKDDVPYISVSGVFGQFKQSLVSHGVPSESALYSCLRVRDCAKLSFPKYPYVALREGELARTPLPVVLAEFVSAQGRIVAQREIHDYAVSKMCISEQLLSLNLSYAPDLLRVNKGEYIHANQLNIQIGDIEAIVAHVEQILSTATSVSVLRVFKDKQVTCRLLGIHTPELLHSILEKFCGERFDAGRYPSIRRTSDGGAAAKRSSIVSEIASFVRDKRSVCSLAELYAHFGDELHYSYSQISGVRYHQDVLYCAHGAVVHVDTLEWSAVKQHDLESLATSHLVDREKADRPFGLVSHIVEHMDNRLPSLPNHVQWTPTLLAELISRPGRYRVIGSQRNAFVSNPNKHGIETLHDLLSFILEKECGGAEKMDVFIEKAREAGILQKSLTPSMLVAKDRLVIEREVIRLAGLEDHDARS